MPTLTAQLHEGTASTLSIRYTLTYWLNAWRSLPYTLQSGHKHACRWKNLNVINIEIVSSLLLGHTVWASNKSSINNKFFFLIKISFGTVKRLGHLEGDQFR